MKLDNYLPLSSNRRITTDEENEKRKDNAYGPMSSEDDRTTSANEMNDGERCIEGSRAFESSRRDTCASLPCGSREAQ